MNTTDFVRIHPESSDVADVAATAQAAYDQILATQPLPTTGKPERSTPDHAST